MSIDTSKGHPAMDYKEHINTFNGFWKATQILVVLVALVLVFMLVTLV